VKEVNVSLAKKKLEIIQALTREEWEKANSQAESSGAQPGATQWHERD